MARRASLCYALFMVAAVGWAQSVYVPIEAINQARADRGLPPVERIAVLDTEAQDFLVYNLEQPLISHEAAPEPERDILHEMYASLFAHEYGLEDGHFTMYELLAEGKGVVTTDHIAHEFDESPFHSEVYYNPTLRYVGYVLFFMGERWVYVFYGVTIDAKKQLGQENGFHQG